MSLRKLIADGTKKEGKSNWKALYDEIRSVLGEAASHCYNISMVGTVAIAKAEGMKGHLVIVIVREGSRDWARLHQVPSGTHGSLGIMTRTIVINSLLDLEMEPIE